MSVKRIPLLSVLLFFALEGWKKSLGGRPEVTFRLYSALTHLFMTGASPGAGLGTPEDYQKPVHVDAAVIGGIADWILK